MAILQNQISNSHVYLSGNSVYLFSNIHPESGHTSVVFAVITRSSEQITFMQHLLEDNPKVSEDMFHIGTLYGHSRFDRANQQFKPISVIDFVLDFIDIDLWINDKYQLKRFMAGVYDSEREYVMEKVKRSHRTKEDGSKPRHVNLQPIINIGEVNVVNNHHKSSRRPVEVVEVVEPIKLSKVAALPPKQYNPLDEFIKDIPDHQVEKIESGLKNLGFKKSQIDKFIKSYDGDFSDPVEVVTAALSRLNG